MSSVYEKMKIRAKYCADEIKKHDHVHVVSHIDADGLTSAGIICKALGRSNIDYSIQFIKQLDETIIKEIGGKDYNLVIFTDLGSGMLSSIQEHNINAIVSDHHVPRGDIDLHLNPHLFGANGSSELSGSGTTYILATQLGNNTDLADLAIVGAVGDLQHSKHGKLIGLNRKILDEGMDHHVLDCYKDITFFGKQTRPVFKLLQFASDPYLPGLTGNEDACIEFLASMNLRFSGDERWRRWIDLTQDEKQTIVSSLFQYSLNNGISSYKLNRIVGEVYNLMNETEGTEMRDASEYSTLLNATARYDHADIGLAVCMGDRGEAYEAARRLLNEHRQNLVNGLQFVKENGVTILDNLQYFDAGKNIRETIVGIIAGMSTTIVENRDLPIIAFADTDNGVKVSARATQDLLRKGVNLSKAISDTCNEIGGSGGGHDIAAGATIPSELRHEFITKLDQVIGHQMNQK